MSEAPAPFDFDAAFAQLKQLAEDEDRARARDRATIAEQAAELRRWYARAQGVCMGLVFMFFALMVWTWVAPTYTGDWIGASALAAFVLGPIMEKLTRSKATE